MTSTEFLIRDKSGKYEPLFKNKQIQTRVVDGVLITVFLSGFLGLVLLLLK